MLRCGQNKVSFFPGRAHPALPRAMGIQTARPPPPTDIHIPGRVNVKRIGHGIPGHPGIAPVAPSRREMPMQPMSAAGTGLSTPQVARSARRGYSGCGRGPAGPGSGRSLPDGPRCPARREKNRWMQKWLLLKPRNP